MPTTVLGTIRADVTLNDSGFRRGVASINKQLQAVRSHFDASAARAKAFGKEEEQLKLRSQSLAKQIELQRKKVDALSRAYAKYKKDLGAGNAETQKLAHQLVRANAALTRMEAQQRKVNNQMTRSNQEQRRYTQALSQLEQKTRLAQSGFKLAEERARAFGSATDQLRVKQQNLSQSLELQRKRVAVLSLAYKESAERLGKHAKETQQAAIRLNEARAAMARLQGDLNRANQRLTQHTSLFARMGKGYERFKGMALEASAGLAMFGGSMSIAVGSAVRSAMDFESAFAGVRKTVDASEKEFAALSQGIRNMAKEMPQSHEEIAKVAEVAGQLGIKKDDILKFTRTMVDMGVATNMSSEEAATALARLANITQMPMNQIDRLGATVVHLGNNLATTEAEIVEMGLRIAGAGHQVNMTEAQILSFAAALSSVGIKAESGGTAISRVMLQMNTDVQEGGRRLELFAKVAGMSATQFKKSFQRDAAGAIIAFIEGLGRMKKDGQNVVPVLKELSLNEIRVRDALLRASGAGDLFRRSLQMGSKAWKENSALTNEAQERYKTAASQFKIFQNRIKDVAISIGSALLPVFNQMLRALDPLIRGFQKFADWFGKLSAETKTSIGIFAAVTGGLIALGAAIAGIVAIANPVTGAIVGISTLLGVAGASAYKSRKELEKTTEDAVRFGYGVSEGTRKAAKGFLDLRDQAQINLVKLRYTTGAEAEKLVNETVQIFSKMGDKVVAALDKDRINVQKAAAALLQEVPREMEGAVKSVEETALKRIDAQVRKVQEANKIIHEGLVKYGGQVAKMPKQFAKAYNQALNDLDQTAQTFVKKVDDMSSFMERIQADQGKITASGARKWVKETQKAYEDAEKAAKKWAKEQKKIWEEQYANGHITKEQYDLMIKATEQGEREKLKVAKDARKKTLEELEKSLSDEAHLYDLRTGELLQIMKSHKDGIIASEEERIKRGKALNKEYFEELIKEAEQFSKKTKKSRDKLIKEYGDMGAKSAEELAKNIQKGGNKARIAAQMLAIETRDGLKIDLGPEGMVSVETFIKGLETGKYGAREVAIAHMNQLRKIYGEGSFTSEGIQVIESFAEGLRSKKPEEVAEQLGLDLKSKMKIDLGPYGQMTSKSFAQGLSDGTLSFDAVYAYFRNQLKQGMKFDLSKEGRENIATLKNGMKVGAFDAVETAHLLGLDIKSKVKVDLGPEGKHTVKTLIAGFESGKIDVDSFVKGLQQLIKNGATIDLTDQGKKAGKTQADGIRSQKGNVKGATSEVRKASENEAARANATSAGKKLTKTYAQGVSSESARARGSAAAIASGVKSALRVSGAYGIGANAGSAFASGLRSKVGSAMAAAGALASAATNALMRALAIRSPSRVFMELGEYTAEGFEVGMLDGLSRVKRAGEMLAQASAPDQATAPVVEMSGGAGGGNTYITNEYTINVTTEDSKTVGRDVIRALANYEALRR